MANSGKIEKFPVSRYKQVGFSVEGRGDQGFVRGIADGKIG